MEHFIQLLSDALEKDSEKIDKKDEFRNYEE